MKFWELISLYRDEIEVLEKTLAEKKWHEFQDMFYDYDFLIESSGRDLLDKVVPIELVTKLASLSQQQFLLDSKKILRKHLKTDDISNVDTLSMQSVLDNYGQNALLEIEKNEAFKISA
jgi:hypothetical protein